MWLRLKQAVLWERIYGIMDRAKDFSLEPFRGCWWTTKQAILRKRISGFMNRIFSSSGTVMRILVNDNTGTNLDLLATFVDEEWLESEDEMNDDPTSQVALGHASELNDDLGGPCDQEDKEKWTGNSNSTISPDGEDVFNGNPLGTAEPSVFIHVHN
ncbi:uncharacterized protein LOC120415248 isoform X2 [Culex pipiens pallens]|uniref:uncharacterized protein LOC120415248 isoform X2 n=1 Tax=Culex pipiens pallens TaxID=42434 RepID=UPI0022AABBE1|nr:uncharacterized protein LOC120415248 isoform X2 [Culex pipiens pallens]